jgi:hypothetical protein
MDTHLMDILRPLLGLILGGTVGLGFGLIQTAAHRRNEKLLQDGRLPSGWAVMPGSMRRVAYLLIVLALVQIISPALFAGGSQWWVSAGVAAGYGALLFPRLRRQRMASALTSPPRH